MSEEDRRRFTRQVESLVEAETDDPGSPAARAALVRVGNDLRAAAGLPPHPDEEEEPPELELHRRAKALGMVGRGR